MSEPQTEPAETNPHLLDHLVDTGRTRAVEATEDIFTAQGVKLLAKGSRIAPELRERILQHRLLKPLEDCVSVADALTGADLARAAAVVLERQPLIGRLCDVGGARPPAETLAALPLSGPVRSLFTVYGRYQKRLHHGVGVALLALGFARRLLPGEVERQRLLALAGLLHDVGELYIDPKLFEPGSRIGPQEWRHIVSHPATGHQALRRLEGAGREVADAVLLHHERLSGHGYPRGVAGDAVTLHGQILGAAEWLMATLESGMTVRARATVATRLIADDFDPRIIATFATTSLGEGERPAADGPMLTDAAPRMARIAETLERNRAVQPWLQARRAEGGEALQQMIDRGGARMQRIEAGFASVGLNSVAPEILLHQIGALGDPELQAEVLAVLQELEWRLREIERETLLRAAFMPPADAAVLHELVRRIAPPR